MGLVRRSSFENFHHDGKGLRCPSLHRWRWRLLAGCPRWADFGALDRNHAYRHNQIEIKRDAGVPPRDAKIAHCVVAISHSTCSKNFFRTIQKMREEHNDRARNNDGGCGPAALPCRLRSVHCICNARPDRTGRGGGSRKAGRAGRDRRRQGGAADPGEHHRGAAKARHRRRKAAFEAYDSLWNGIEMYVSTRSKDMYDALEHVLQARIEKAFGAPNPDVAALLADAQAILVKYDKAIDMVSKAAPLNPLYDDIARLRIVRAHLREVVPALKVGNFDKARKSYAAFDNTWDSIEDMIKARSADDYVAIEKGMIEIEKALMPEKPDVAAATALVNGVMAKYNVTVTELIKEALSRSAGGSHGRQNTPSARGFHRDTTHC